MRLSRSKRTPRKRRSRGQSLVEFSLVFPVLMLIIGGTIQFGIIFWGQNTLNQVVRDTGRWAATQLDCNASSAKGPIVTKANAIAGQSSLIGYSAGGISGGEVTVAFRTDAGPCPPASNQDISWVDITIDHDVPIFFPFVPGNGHLSSSTEFRIEPKP